MIKDVGECAPLTKEYRIKLLMEKLPGAERDLAKLLVTTDKSTQGSTSDVCADQLAVLFAREKLTTSEITDLRAHCSEQGGKAIDRAFRRYKQDPVYKGRAELANTLLLKGLEDQVKAEEGGKKYSDEQVKKDVDSASDAYEEMMRLRQYLSDEYNIESKADYRMMMDALRVTYRANKEFWQKGNRQVLNQLTRQAKKLYDSAKNYRCSPSHLHDWRQLKKKPMNPNAVYRRPDGVEIWGSGELVIQTPDGPKRPVQTIFGKVMGEGSIPMSYEMDEIIKNAFPDEEPPKPET